MAVGPWILMSHTVKEAQKNEGKWREDAKNALTMVLTDWTDDSSLEEKKPGFSTQKVARLEGQVWNLFQLETQFSSPD